MVKLTDIKTTDGVRTAFTVDGQRMVLAIGKNGTDRTCAITVAGIEVVAFNTNTVYENDTAHMDACMDAIKETADSANSFDEFVESFG